VDLGVTTGRLRDPREDFQKGALAGAVSPDDTNDLSALDFK
jgi:hypothetical protein